MDDDQAGTPLWEVTGQQETVDLAETGNYVNGTRVSFRTRSGALGSIFIPTAQYTVARARELLTARASDMEAVHNLKGPG